MNEHIITLIIGIGMLIVALKFSRKQTGMNKTGVHAEGIVYDLAENHSGNDNAPVIVIRFLTMNQQWITETVRSGITHSLYKKGQKVSVIYNEKDPKDFIIDSKMNNVITYIILIAGCLMILYAAYKLIGI